MTFTDELENGKLIDNLKDDNTDKNSYVVTIFQYLEKQKSDSCICLASAIKLANSQRKSKTGQFFVAHDIQAVMGRHIDSAKKLLQYLPSL